MRLTHTSGVQRALFNLVLKSWAATIKSGSGTLGSTTLSYAYYRQWGSIVFYDIKFTINTLGTGAGNLQVSLPPGFTPVGNTQTGVAHRLDTGHLHQSIVFPNTIQVRSYTGAFAGENGASFILHGWFRI